MHRKGVHAHRLVLGNYRELIPGIYFTEEGPNHRLSQA